MGMDLSFLLSFSNRSTSQLSGWHPVLMCQTQCFYCLGRLGFVSGVLFLFLLRNKLSEVRFYVCHAAGCLETLSAGPSFPDHSMLLDTGQSSCLPTWKEQRAEEMLGRVGQSPGCVHTQHSLQKLPHDNTLRRESEGEEEVEHSLGHYIFCIWGLEY